MSVRTWFPRGVGGWVVVGDVVELHSARVCQLLPLVSYASDPGEIARMPNTTGLVSRSLDRSSRANLFEGMKECCCGCMCGVIDLGLVCGFL